MPISRPVFFFLKDPKSGQHLCLPEKTKDCSFLLDTITLKYVLQKKSAVRQLEGSQGAGCATTHKGQQKLIYKIRAATGTQNNIYATIHIFSSPQSWKTKRLLNYKFYQAFPQTKILGVGRRIQMSFSPWASPCKYSNSYSAPWNKTNIYNTF